MNSEKEVFRFSLKHQEKIIYYLLVFCFFWPQFAFAYVDPGSVSILLQVIAAFLLGGLITFKNKIIQLIKSVYHLFLIRR
jgi:hypothetical protein